MWKKKLNVTLLVGTALAFFVITLLNNESFWLTGFNELASVIKPPYWVTIVAATIVGLLIYACYRLEFKTLYTLSSIATILAVTICINYQVRLSLATNDVRFGVIPFFNESLALSDIELVAFKSFSLQYETASGEVQAGYYPLLGKQQLVSVLDKIGNCVSKDSSVDSCTSIKIEYP